MLTIISATTSTTMMLTTAGTTAYPCNPDHATWDDSYDDSYGTCSGYLANGWCTPDGQLGPKWSFEAGDSFESFAKGGFHAGNCPECGCKDISAPAGNHLFLSKMHPNLKLSFNYCPFG